jgi:hypothetical protein
MNSFSSPVKLTKRSSGMALDVRSTQSVQVRLRASVDLSFNYGIEILKPAGWAPLTGFMSRKRKRFTTLKDAVEACIVHWRKTGQAARPFLINKKQE